MNLKILKRIVCVICILSVLFMIQIPANAAISASTNNFEGTVLSSDVELPSSFSSKKSGYTTPTRKQIGQTDWAYSAMASLEILLRRDNVYNEYLSPMHMAGVSTTAYDPQNYTIYYNYEGRPNYIYKAYNEGATMDFPIGYLTSWKGAKAESDFPETMSYEEFVEKDANSKATIAGVNSVMYLNGSDINTIKTAIYKYGSVVGEFYCSDKYFNVPTSLYYCGDDIDLTQGGTCSVCVVGWDDDCPKELFYKDNIPKKDGAWLCKSSKGNNWGSNGYFWISYEDKSLFKKNSYALMDYQQPEDNIKLYQNETHGAKGEINCGQATYVNVFDFSDKYTVLDKINFETTSQGYDYSIYYIPMSKNNPSSPDKNKNTWKQLGTGKIEYNGCISVDIDDFTVESGKGAIGISIQKNNENTNTYGSIGFFTVPGKLLGLYEFSNLKGDSYILRDYETQKLDSQDSFVIKAVAKKNIVTGDADGDDYVTICDVTAIQRYLAEFINFDENQKKAADANRDNYLNIKDATKIQRVLAELDTFDEQ